MNRILRIHLTISFECNYILLQGPHHSISELYFRNWGWRLRKEAFSRLEFSHFCGCLKEGWSRFQIPELLCNVNSIHSFTAGEDAQKLLHYWWRWWGCRAFDPCKQNKNRQIRDFCNLSMYRCIWVNSVHVRFPLIKCCLFACPKSLLTHVIRVSNI